MILSKQVELLEKERDEELQKLRTHAVEAWEAASPERWVTEHPYITLGTALTLGMLLAPGPAKERKHDKAGSKNGSASSGGGGFLGLAHQLLAHFVPGLKVPSDGRRSFAEAFTVSPPSSHSFLDLLGVAQSLLGNLGGVVQSRRTNLNAMVSDCGTMDANTLKSQLVTPDAGSN